MNGAGGHDRARNRRCCTGVRHIEDYQDAWAFRGSAIHRNQFPTSGFDEVLGRLVTIGFGIFHDAVERLAMRAATDFLYAAVLAAPSALAAGFSA
jgi:hypothetical protein